MLRAWFRTRRDLHTELAGVRDWNTELADELEDLNDENAGLKRQLDAARIEVDAVKAERDKLHDVRRELRQQKTRADALEQRLAQMQQTSIARDRRG